MPDDENWIAALGPRAVSDEPEDSAISFSALNDPNLSLTAKGLYALVLSAQGQAVNPFLDALEDADDIQSAIDELVDAGLIVRVPTP